MPVGEIDRLGHAHAFTYPPSLAQAVDALAGWDGVTAFVEIKRSSLRRFGRETVLRRVSEVLRPVLDRCVLISFDLPTVKILRLMTGARIGWVLSQYDADAAGAGRRAGAAVPVLQPRAPARRDRAAVARSVGLGAVRGARPEDGARLPRARRPFRRDDGRARPAARLRGEPPPVVTAGDGLVLALDQGSHASRAVLFDAAGTPARRCAASPSRPAAKAPTASSRIPRNSLGRCRPRSTDATRVTGRRRNRWPPASPPSGPRSSHGVAPRVARCATRFPGRTAAMPAWLAHLAPAGAARARDHRAAALAALRREQAALVSRPRAGRAARRRDGRSRLRTAVELPRLAPHRGATVRGRPGQRVAHAAVRSRRNCSGRRSCCGCSISIRGTCPPACRRAARSAG